MYLKTGSLMTWMVFCCCGPRVMQGQASSCIDNIQCYSNDYAYQECEIEEAQHIINASVFRKISKSECKYDDGSAKQSDGRYGYVDNILWVHQGCRAVFKVCYTDKFITQPKTQSSSTTHTVTTILSDPPSSSEDTDNSQITEYATFTEVFGTTNSNQHFNTSEYLEPHEQEASTLPIPAIVIPVIIVLLGLTLLGLFLWKKRRSKAAKSERKSCNSKQISGNRSSANSNAYSIMNEPSGNKSSTTNSYSELDAPQRKDNNYIVVGPEHSYASIYPEVKSDKTLENKTQTDKAGSPTSTVTGAAEYFILEPNSFYSKMENSKHYSQERHTPEDSLNQPCLLSESALLHKKATNNSVNTQNRESSMEYHNYFKLEGHGLESPLEFMADTNDMKTAYNGQDRNNSVNSHSYFVLEHSDNYNTIDPEDVVIQTLPDNVYNTTNTKSKEVIQDPNYDTLNRRPQEEIENDTNEYSHTQKRTKQDNDTIDYSHVNIVRENDC